MYQVALQQFTGPLDLLLQLVEKRNLEITQVSLSQITQDYLEYLTRQTIAPTELAEFLVIASTLLLIKSKALLPTLELKAEEEEEIYDLEHRLKIFKLFKAKSQEITQRYEQHKFLFTRPSWVGINKTFLPPIGFELKELVAYYQMLVKDLSRENATLPERKVQKIISLKHRIKELLQYFTRGKEYNLNELISQKENRAELIVTFLALLHLVKEKLVNLKQNNNFGEIWISSI